MIFQRSIITSVCVLWLLLAKIYTYDTKYTSEKIPNSQHVAVNLSNRIILLQNPPFVKNTFDVSESINNYNSYEHVKDQAESVITKYKSGNYHLNTSLNELNKFQFKTNIQKPLNAKTKLLSTADISSVQKYNSSQVLFRLNALKTAKKNFNSHSQSLLAKGFVKGSDKQKKRYFVGKSEFHRDFNRQTQSVYGLIKDALDKVELICNLARKHVEQTYLNNFSGYRQPRKKHPKLLKKFKKFMLPLLLAYKLKFLTLIPVLIGGLVLLVGTTGLAGFFFALFAAVMTLKIAGSTHHDVMVKG